MTMADELNKVMDEAIEARQAKARKWARSLLDDLRKSCMLAAADGDDSASLRWKAPDGFRRSDITVLRQAIWDLQKETGLSLDLLLDPEEERRYAQTQLDIAGALKLGTLTVHARW